MHAIERVFMFVRLKFYIGFLEKLGGGIINCIIKSFTVFSILNK